MLSKHMEKENEISFLEEKSNTINRITQKLEERFSLDGNGTYSIYEFKIDKNNFVMKIKLASNSFLFYVECKEISFRSKKSIGFGSKSYTLKLAEKSAMNFIRRAETIKNIYETIGLITVLDQNLKATTRKQSIYFSGNGTVEVHFLNDKSPVNFLRGFNLKIYSIELKKFLSIDSKEKADAFLEKNKR